jgi:hypothetical protein
MSYTSDTNNSCSFSLLAVMIDGRPCGNTGTQKRSDLRWFETQRNREGPVLMNIDMGTESSGTVSHVFNHIIADTIVAF